MVEKITNSIANLENKTSKNSVRVEKSFSQSNDYASDNSSYIKIDQKNVVNELASQAPIDNDKVSSIKKAISSGDYPLDLDKITDALMEAYNDMKS